MFAGLSDGFEAVQRKTAHSLMPFDQRVNRLHMRTAQRVDLSLRRIEANWCVLFNRISQCSHSALLKAQKGGEHVLLCHFQRRTRTAVMLKADVQ